MPSESSGSGTDQYDTLLKAMEEGLLISINGSTESSPGTGQLRVESSRPEIASVRCVGDNAQQYTISRDTRGELVVNQLGEDGVEWSTEVITIEILGIYDGPQAGGSDE